MRNFWGVKPLNINRQPFRFGLDTDRDRVLDWKDCQWWNPYKQHLTPRRKAEIDALPILVANEEYANEPVLHYKDYPEQEPEMFPIGSKEAKEKAPIATSQVYSTFNRHPELISRVKRVQEEWAQKGPEEFKKLQSGKFSPLPEKPPELVRVGLTPERDDLAYSEGGRINLGTMPFGFRKEIADRVLVSKIDYPVKPQDIAADVIHHELTHEEQRLRDEKMMEKYDRFHGKNLMRGLENPFDNLGKDPSEEEWKEAERKWEEQKPERERLAKERYRLNPYEANADIVARQYIDKRLKKVPEEEVYEGFRNVIE